MDAQMLWCGSVRCYFLPRTKGPNVAAVVSSGHEDRPVMHVWLRRYDRQPRDTHDLGELFAHALTELLDDAKGFPLHGIHWVPRSAGGDGAVLTDGVPRKLTEWAAMRVRDDLRHLRDKHGWEL